MLRVVKTRQEVGDRRLAGAAGPDQRGQLARLDAEGHLLQRRPALAAVHERHAVELDFAAHVGDCFRAGLVGDLDGHVEVFEEALEDR